MSTQRKVTFLSLAVVIVLILSACASLPALSRFGKKSQPASAGSAATAPISPVIEVQQATAAPTQAAAATTAPAQPPANSAPAASNGANQGLVAAYQTMLENIYTQVGPSVVNIRVVEGGTTSSSQGNNQGNGQGNGQGNPNNPFGLPFGNGGQGQVPQVPSEGLGSGFVWDTQGHIVTNNHVVSGATKIEVTFADGSTVPATVVGTDGNSDLAVIKVEATSEQLKPVVMGDSKQVKVGQIAIAIGNPFGLQGTMTSGIVSALGRSISATNNLTTNGQDFSIPDIIQTDAPINPGNSGGVLVNDQGQVIGVTAAIESNSGSNSGIGFAIPADMVKEVVPALIQNGHYDHPYLGISGTNLTPDLATAMNLKTTQRGALVVEVVQGGPADKAGLRASNQQANIDGQQTPVGGDVIIAANGQAINSMDELIAYLSNSTKVSQKVTFTILRNGQQTQVEVTLAARPTNSQ